MVVLGGGESGGGGWRSGGSKGTEGPGGSVRGWLLVLLLRNDLQMGRGDAPRDNEKAEAREKRQRGQSPGQVEARWTRFSSVGGAPWEKGREAGKEGGQEGGRKKKRLELMEHGPDMERERCGRGRWGTGGEGGGRASLRGRCKAPEMA